MRGMRMLAILLLAGLAACESLNLGPDGGRWRAGPEGALQAERVSERIRLTNTGSRPIYFHVIDSELATRALWGPCLDPACRHVEPGGRVVTDWPEFDAGAPGGGLVALVYWWYLVRDGRNGFAVDSLRVVPVSR
jgi:hypothetical protein